MYEAYWGLREKPFANTPDARFFYFSRQHEEALTRLLYAVTEDKGAMALTGDYGCGKTLLSRILLERLDPDRFEMAILPHPNLSPSEFLREILRQFGRPAPADADKADLLRLVEEALVRNAARERRAVILVDEAQAVRDPATLEEIRLLLNYQQNDRFLLTLLLLGQPELREALTALPQLEQRLAVRYHLGPLGEEDGCAYLRHRLSVAGSRHELFESGAERFLVRAAQGVPRRINNLADMALLVGFGQKAPVVDEAIAQRVADDMMER